MNQDGFTAQHEAQWERLEDWLAGRQGAARVPAETIPHLYRQVCHHLALARERQYSASLVERLNNLVLDGHRQLYRGRGGGLLPLLQFLLHGFPALVRREWRLVLLSSLLFYGPLAAMFIALQNQPELIYSLLPPSDVGSYEAMYDPASERPGRERGAADDFLMFGVYIKNNIGIGFQTFASGLLFGLGSIFYLVYNGLHIGAVAGHLVRIDYGVPFFSFVAGHSALELTAIVIAGAAGLRLGLALLRPGPRSRLRALRENAQVSVRLIYGVALMLLAAAFIEAFWSSTAGIPPEVKYAVGLGLWLVVLAYFLLLGRRRAA